MDGLDRYTNPEQFSLKLANRLRSLRDERGLSQESVAHEAGISTYTYQKFEKGESKPGTPMNPRLYTLLALADVFEMDVRELLTFDGNP
ncbi:helix-turn-helix transcriptional regulator [Eggerthella guodeyinii]|uniref:Helix-turn-helix domain-containing protein n=1 Tax=Eggerthella guodeyinii TaxID=2690837 RepID=A0A6N7RK29_9ACTN|nr:helix-turn-helix transcriptional regulator [Eggerthella guodeyinii]MRX81663.1 helix-turn-helix domain-containing protein [Eggerthella guodeyinii]